MGERTVCRELETPEWPDDLREQLAAANKAAAERPVTRMPDFVGTIPSVPASMVMTSTLRPQMDDDKKENTSE